MPVLPVVVLFKRTAGPNAVLWQPLKLPLSANAPSAELLSPLTLLKERLKAVRRVAAAGGVTKSAPPPLAVLPLPVAFVKSANAPLAVLDKPVVLLKSAAAP